MNNNVHGEFHDYSRKRLSSGYHCYSWPIFDFEADMNLIEDIQSFVRHFENITLVIVMVKHIN